MFSAYVQKRKRAEEQTPAYAEDKPYIRVFRVVSQRREKEQKRAKRGEQSIE